MTTSVLQRRPSVRGRGNRRVNCAKSMVIINEEFNEQDQDVQRPSNDPGCLTGISYQESSYHFHQPTTESNPSYPGSSQPKGFEVNTPASSTAITPSPPGLTPSDVHEDIETPSSCSHTVSDVKALRFKQVGPDSQTYSPRITKAQWETHRKFIETLHYQNKSRLEMLTVLASEKNFRPSIHQLNAKMMAWKLKVYNKQDQHQNLVPGELTPVSTSSNRENTSTTTTKSVRDSAAIVNTGEQSHGFPSLEAEPDNTVPLDLNRDNLGVVVDPEDYDNDFAEMPDPMLDPFTIDAEKEYCIFIATRDLESVHRRSSVTMESSNTTIRPSSNIELEAADLVGNHDDWPLSLDEIRIKIDFQVLQIAEHYGANYHNALNDISQLMYACRMFSVAFEFSHLCYEDLKSSCRQDEHRLPFAELNCVRSATSPEHIKIAGRLAAAFQKSSRKLAELPRRKLWIHFKEVIGEYDREEDVAFSPGSTTANDIAGIFWDHYFILEHDDNSKDQLAQVSIIKQKALDNAKPLHDEQCLVWEILRECCTLVQGYEGDISWDRVGCHFVRQYASHILSYKPEKQEPFSSEQRAAEIISFKSEVYVFLVIGHWVSESITQTQTESPFEDPAIRLERHLQSLSNLPLRQRASKFQNHQKAVYQVPIKERKTMDCTSPHLSYIIDTAIHLAKASVHLRKLIRYTWADPILGQHLVSPTSSLRSRTSITSRHTRQQQLLARDGSKSSINTHSSGYMSICSRPSLRFSAVTGLRSPNPSVRSTNSEMMEIN